MNAEYETPGGALGDARGYPPLSPTWTARRRDIRSITGFRVSRPRRVRSDRASRPASAWRSPRNGSRPLQPPGFRDFRLRYLCGVRRWLHDGRRRPQKLRRSPVTSASTISAGSTTTTTSPSRVTPASPSPRTSLRAFWATVGTSLRVGDANDIDRIERALGSVPETKGRPTFIILDSHIGYGSPHKQDTADAHGEPLGEEEMPAHQTELRLARGREISRSRRCI